MDEILGEFREEREKIRPDERLSLEGLVVLGRGGGVTVNLRSVKALTAAMEEEGV
jgi:hypothetical protein